MKTIHKVNLTLAAVLAAMVLVAMTTRPMRQRMPSPGARDTTGTDRLQEVYEVEITYGWWIDSAGATKFVPSVPVVRIDSTAN